MVSTCSSERKFSHVSHFKSKKPGVIKLIVGGMLKDERDQRVGLLHQLAMLETPRKVLEGNEFSSTEHTNDKKAKQPNG